MASGSFQQIRVEIEGAVGTLWLARPAVRNAMTDQMGHEIAEAVRELDAMEDLRVLLVRGEGKSFAAGGDFAFIEERAAGQPEHNRRLMRAFYERFLSIRRLRVPTIAVLHGAAVGAGMCFALACDIRLAAEQARLGFNFVRIGLHPGMGATYLLPRLVGPARAAELLLTGRLIEAREAAALGLVNRAYAAHELLPAALAMATEIAAAAPLAVGRTKSTLQRALERSLEAALDAEASAQALDYATEDMAEGIRAFYAKQAPRFQGR